MAAHDLSLGKSDEWYTPAEVFAALDLWFDTDVASPGARTVPWIPTDNHITRNSLNREWTGRVWMNPPFGKRNGYQPWAERFISHGNGVALAPNRTAAPWFQYLMACCDAALFWAPKIKMVKPDGSVGKSPGYGTVLLAIGESNVAALRKLHLKRGVFCTVRGNS